MSCEFFKGPSTRTLAVVTYEVAENVTAFDYAWLNVLG